MGDKGLRDTSRRLVVELAVVVALVSVPVGFPRSTPTGTAWRFVVQHPLLLLHVAVGTLIVAESLALLVRAIAGAGSGIRPAVLAAIGTVFVVLAFASGFTFVGTGQHESTLTAMSVGWLGAIATYGAGWVIGHRALAAQRGAIAPR